MGRAQYVRHERGYVVTMEVALWLDVKGGRHGGQTGVHERARCPG